jgi:uncharacterized protein YcbX
MHRAGATPRDTAAVMGIDTTMAPPRVARINVTPVKSLRLHHPDALWLDRQGAAEDRRFLLVDHALRLYNGNRDAVLVRASAAWDSDSRRLTMTVPGAGTLAGDVVRNGSTAVNVYGRRVPGHIVEGPWASALSDLVGRKLTLVEREDGARATDVRPVTLVSRASLGFVGGDGRRFRMMLEVDGLAAMEEETWRNRRVRVGDATVLVRELTHRCGVPSVDPDTGRRDRDMLRELIDVREAIDGQACLGVYAEVLTPGLVCVGDTLEPSGHARRTTRYFVDRARISSRRLSTRR